MIEQSKEKRQLKSNYPLQKIYHNLKPFLNVKSSFYENQPIPSQQLYQALVEFEILVVGAGGLGCQIVKNLAVSGVRNIHLIDMDTIDLTNLNRQFLFRLSDVGKYKADVVADFVMKRCPGVKIHTYRSRVQQQNLQFYSKFSIIIAGLDNVQARQYLNNLVHKLNLESQQTLCFYIDGSTEKLSGQCLVVEPFVTACYNCSRSGLTEKTKANFCTIASTPRAPEHCVQYVIEILWHQQFPDRKLDGDNIQDMKWVFEQSLKRANEFKIEGVTQMLALGVTKNIIPAVASTNAMIGAACTNQALKLITYIHPRLNNYFMYLGGTMIGGLTESLSKEQDCPVTNMKICMPLTATLGDISNKIKQTYGNIQPYLYAGSKLVLNPADTERYPEQLLRTISITKQKYDLKDNLITLQASDKSLKSDLKVIISVE